VTAIARQRQARWRPPTGERPMRWSEEANEAKRRDVRRRRTAELEALVGDALPLERRPHRAPAR